MKQLTSILKLKKAQVLADQLMFSGMSFLTTLALARILKTVDFGIYATIILGIFLIVSLGNALIIQPFQVATAKRQNSIVYSSLLFFLQCFFLVITLLVAFPIYIASGGVMNHFPSLALIISGIVLHDYFRKYFLAKNDLTFTLFIDSLLTAIQIIGIGYLAIQHSPNLNTAFMIIGGSYFPSIIFSVVKLKPVFRKTEYWKKLFKYQLKEGVWLCMVSFIQWGAGNLFVVSLGIFISVEALGAFRLIQSLFGLLNILFQTFENYVLPNASKIYSKSTILSKNYIKKTSLQTAVLIGFVLLILFLFSKEIMQLFAGNRYIEYSYVIKSMCILYFFIFIGYPIRLCIRMLLLNKSFFIGYLLSFIFNIVFFNYLLKTWQLNGVIVGLIANQIILLLYWNYQLHKKHFYLWK